MTQLLFYGNCQVGAVEQTLKLDPGAFVTRSVECWTTTIAKEEFTAAVAKADILVMQPIADGYRGLDYLSTSYILRHRKKASKVFLFDSCYFRFYYCDMRYREWNSMRLSRPISYHYDTMVECYLGGKTIDEYLEKGPSGFFVGDSMRENTSSPRRLTPCLTRNSTSKSSASQLLGG